MHVHREFLLFLLISKGRIFQAGALHMDPINFYFDIYIVLFHNLHLDSRLLTFCWPKVGIVKLFTPNRLNVQAFGYVGLPSCVFLLKSAISSYSKKGIFLHCRISQGENCFSAHLFLRKRIDVVIIILFFLSCSLNILLCGQFHMLV